MTSVTSPSFLDAGRDAAGEKRVLLGRDIFLNHVCGASFRNSCKLRERALNREEIAWVLFRFTTDLCNSETDLRRKKVELMSERLPPAARK
jgi:hypothetical protein